MQPVGFEPTRPKPADLKSAPLDHSGMVAYSLPRPYYNYNISLDAIPMLLTQIVLKIKYATTNSITNVTVVIATFTVLVICILFNSASGQSLSALQDKITSFTLGT